MLELIAHVSGCSIWWRSPGGGCFPRNRTGLSERHGVTVHVPPGQATDININVIYLVQTEWRCCPLDNHHVAVGNSRALSKVLMFLNESM